MIKGANILYPNIPLTSIVLELREHKKGLIYCENLNLEKKNRHVIKLMLFFNRCHAIKHMCQHFCVSFFPFSCHLSKVACELLSIFSFQTNDKKYLCAVICLKNHKSYCKLYVLTFFCIEQGARHFGQITTETKFHRGHKILIR